MHFTAQDDPEKIRRAELFNPVRVARVMVSFAADSYKERQPGKPQAKRTKKMPRPVVAGASVYPVWPHHHDGCGCGLAASAFSLSFTLCGIVEQEFEPAR